MHSPDLNRRDAIAALLAISASSALGACGKAAEVAASTGEPDLSLHYASAARFFGKDELARIGAIAETIVPETDTAGAIRAGVPTVIQKLASEWGEDDFRAYWRGGLKQLGDTLDGAAGESFVALSPERREAVLGAYDAKVFSGAAEDEFYRHFKNTTVTAYYMSEPGATEELAYEAVPGEWIGCASIERFPKQWAT